MIGRFVLHNGVLIPKEHALVPVDRIEWTYGFGVYENIRTRARAVLFIEKHIDRLLASAATIGLEHPFSRADIRHWIRELVETDESSAVNIKILLIGGRSRAEADLYVMLLAPKFLEKKCYRDGVKTVTTTYERYLPQAKTLNMLPSYLLFREAAKQQAHDMLLVDHTGCILEGTRSNFFALKNRTLFTASLDKVLNGVTRQTVIECAEKHGYALTETPVLLDNASDYDGAFLTHTSGGIVPIRSIDTITFHEVSPALKELMRAYTDFVDALYPEQKLIPH